MYMMTDSMHTLSPLIRTACGGIGVGTIHTVQVGDLAGDGLLHGTTIVGMLPVIGAVAIGVDTGDITIIITILAMDGVEAIGEAAMDGLALIMTIVEQKRGLVETRLSELPETAMQTDILPDV